MEDNRVFKVKVVTDKPVVAKVSSSRTIKVTTEGVKYYKQTFNDASAKPEDVLVGSTFYSKYSENRQEGKLDPSNFSSIKSISLNGETLQPDENKNIDIKITKGTLGLGKVDNTADMDKPISTQQQKALNDLDSRKADKTSLEVFNSNFTNINLRIDEVESDLTEIDTKIELNEDAIKKLSQDVTKVSTDLLEVVHKTGEEEISGIKTFINELKLKDGLNVDGTAHLNKGAVIKGDITITGNITQNGENYITHTEEIYSKNDYIYLRDGNTGALTDGAYTGLQFKKYDGINDGRLVVDNKGIARVGDVGDEQPLATREETPIDGGYAKWDNTRNRFITVNNVATLENITNVENKIPTKTSQLSNDSGFLTTHQSLDNYYTRLEVDNKIPKNISQLNNDSNFATETYVNENGGKIDSISINSIPQSILNKNVDIKVPVKLSELTNDLNFITNTVNNLSNYYLKTETYTKDEVNTIVNNLSSFNALIVATLPTENISTTTIYLISKTGTGNNDYYDEYLYINNKWEMIGTTQIDLSNYYTKNEVYTKEEVDNKKLPNPKSLTVYAYTANTDEEQYFEYDGTEDKYLNIQIPPSIAGFGVFESDRIYYNAEEDKVYIECYFPNSSPYTYLNFLYYPTESNNLANVSDTATVWLKELQYGYEDQVGGYNSDLTFNDLINKYCKKVERYSSVYNRDIIYYYCPIVKFNSADLESFLYYAPLPMNFPVSSGGNTEGILNNTEIIQPLGDSDPLRMGRGTVAVNYATAIGNNAQVTGTYGVAVGNLTSAGNYGVAVGRDTHSADYGVAIGYNSLGAGGVAIGYGSSGYNTYSVAIGRGAKSNASGAVQIGYGTNSEENTLKFRTDKIYDLTNHRLDVLDAVVNGSKVLTAANFTLDGTTLTITI